MFFSVLTKNIKRRIYFKVLLNLIHMSIKNPQLLAPVNRSRHLLLIFAHHTSYLLLFLLKSLFCHLYIGPPSKLLSRLISVCLSLSNPSLNYDALCFWPVILEPLILSDLFMSTFKQTQRTYDLCLGIHTRLSNKLFAYLYLISPLCTIVNIQATVSFLFSFIQLKKKSSVRLWLSFIVVK